MLNATIATEEASLKRHKKGAVGKGRFPKFPCHDCAKFFCNGKALKGHKCDKLLLADKSDTPIRCDKCCEDFTSRRALKVHVKNSIRLFCKQCPTIAQFCNLKTYKNHILYIHNTESSE